MIFWIFLIERPRPLKAKEISEKKMVLRRKTEELLIHAKNIKHQYEQYEEDKDDFGWCLKRSIKRKNERKWKELKVEYQKLEKQLEVYDLEITLKANPLLDLAQFVGGVLLSIIGLVLICHILFYKLIYTNKKPLSGFLNDFMLFIEFKMARFFSTIIFISIGKEVNFFHELSY